MTNLMHEFRNSLIVKGYKDGEIETGCGTDFSTHETSDNDIPMPKWKSSGLTEEEIFRALEILHEVGD